MGTYYCRSIGVLSSKGEYIFHLDNDDMILDIDSFSTIVNIADKGDFDIVSFMAVFAHHGPNLLTASIMENYFSEHVHNLVLFQPELGLLFFILSWNIFKISKKKLFFLIICFST